MSTTLRLAASEEAALTAALGRALSVAAKARTVDHALLFQLLALRDSPQDALPELRELQQAVGTVPALDLFQHANQCALGRREPVSFRFLIQWLISRAQQVGPERAVADVSRYLESDTVDLACILAVDGFGIERDITFGEYQLVAWSRLAESDTKWQIASRSLFGAAWPSVAVVQRHSVPRTHVRPWDVPGPNPAPPLEPALDLLRCVTAITGAGVRLLHYWIEPPDWAPWVPSHSGFGVDSTVLATSAVLEGASVPSLLEIASRFRGLDESHRARLRVPLDRLSRAHLADLRPVDMAIELGIALESLYAPTKLSEGIAHTVRTRAARFLGGSAERRQGTVSLLRDVYDLRSRAVHAGRFDADGGPKKWREEEKVRRVLEDGRRLVGESLVKVIREGEPDWDDFDIGV
jgi:hypothetical protein